MKSAPIVVWIPTLLLAIPARAAPSWRGPLARARVQLHVLDILAHGRAICLAAGANAAITSARYMSTADGTGLRLEPELEVGLTMRL